MFKKRRNLFIIGFIVLVIVFVIVGRNNRPDPLEVTVETVSTRKVVEVVSANGKVQPEVEVKISPDVSGEIIELPIKEGDQVKKGDLLVSINPDIYLATVERLEASLNTTQANLANAKARLSQNKAQFINAEASFKRNKQLWSDKAISEADYDAAKASFEVAKAEVTAGEQSVEASEFNVKSARAALKEARDNLSRTTIFAPSDGTVSMLNNEKGERVVGTAQMAGTEIMRIADLTNMEVNVDVNESDIVRVSLGDEAEIEVDAYLDRKFEGVVTEIANSANSTGMQTDQVTTFNVKIRILRVSYQDLIDAKNPHLSPFRPGMSATVDIKTATEDGVIAIPIQSVTMRPDTVEGDIYGGIGGSSDEDEEEEEETAAMEEEEEDDERYEVVFVLSEGQSMVRHVKTGIQDNRYIQILSGLEEGEEVITGPYTTVSKKLRNEEPVSKKKKSAASRYVSSED